MSETRADLGISVFFPAFNDAGSIPTLVATALEILPTLTNDYEVIVVNDGSTDETAARVEELSRNYPKVRIVNHERNLGYGAALRSGFRHAMKDLVFYTDGDGQYDVRELPNLHRLMTDRVDVVNGYKTKRSDASSRKVLGAIYNHAARIMFRLPIRDVDCDFRLIRRTCLQDLDIQSATGAVCVEIISKLHRAGCVFAEAPVSHYPRIHGRSQFFTFRRVLNTLIDFSFLWLRTIRMGRADKIQKLSRQTIS